MVLVMSTAHVYSANILSVKWLKSVKIASYVPKLTNGKRSVLQGQNEGKLKKLAGVFPITTANSAKKNFKLTEIQNGFEVINQCERHRIRFCILSTTTAAMA